MVIENAPKFIPNISELDDYNNVDTKKKMPLFLSQICLNWNWISLKHKIRLNGRLEEEQIQEPKPEQIQESKPEQIQESKQKNNVETEDAIELIPDINKLNEVVINTGLNELTTSNTKLIIRKNRLPGTRRLSAISRKLNNNKKLG